MTRSELGRRKRIIMLRGKLCCFCGIVTRGRAPVDTALTIDHRIPRGRNGSNDDDNLFIACLLCNNGRGDFDYEVYLKLVEEHGRRYAVVVASRLRSQRDKVARASRERIKNNLDMT